MPMNDAARDDALTGGQALVRRLTAEGVDTVFLIPGVQLDWAVDALAQTPGMRMIVPRHEQSASYMADGYARVSGKAGVAMVVPGPGILNAGAGLATAYACNSPVLMLVGQIHADSVAQGHGNLHELRDQTRVLEGIVKWNARVTARDRLESTLNAAFREMFNGRTGPVSVEIPYNFLIENAPPGTPLPPGAPDPARAPDARAIRAAADLLNDAEFPLVYVGGGSAGAIDQIRELADRIGLPVIGSENARGHLPDSHPLSFTELEGRELFARADVVLVLASRFMEAMTARPSWPQKGKRWIYLNCESAHLSAPRKADCAICADASLGLRSLLPLLKRHEVVSQADSGRIKARADERISALGDLASYVGALRRALPRNGIFVNELTQVGYLARVAFLMDRVMGYIDAGQKAGASAAIGGDAPATNGGYYVNPTILVNVKPEMSVVKEEIFGPVVVAQRFDDLDEVARAANDTSYGLGASIWTKDVSAMHKLAGEIKSGTIWGNCHSSLDAALPFGGYKQSGIGREKGREGVEAYTELKTVFIKL